MSALEPAPRAADVRAGRPATAWLLAAVVLGLALLVASPRRSAAETAPARSAEPVADSPRTAISDFLEATTRGDWAAAAERLDLRRIPRAQQPSEGPELARQLKIVLDQTVALDSETFSDVPEGASDDGLPANLDRIETIRTPRGPADLLLQRVAAPGGALWKVSAATVAQVPALYQQVAMGPVARYLPPALRDIRILEIALWQWIGLGLLVVAAWLASWLVTRLILRSLRPIAARSRAALDDHLLEVLSGPLRLVVVLVLFFAGLLALALPVAARTFFATAEQAAIIATVAWLMVRALDVLAGRATQRLATGGRSAAVGMVPTGRRVAKILVAGLAAIAILQNAGLNVTGVLAGLGIGGLAVALAGQKTVENLFGGVSLILDQPVRVGDFCRFGDKLGTVEDIGLRSTRVRTLDRTVVAIPNSEFATIQLENFSRRDRIWLHTTIGLRYETTPDQLRWVLVEVRKMLYAHPMVHPDPARVRFVGFGASSLDVEIFAYVLTTDYGEFLEVQEDIGLRLMDIVAASGTGFAFPSRTIYFSRDTGLDPSRSRAAEEQVQGWRERSEIYLPGFPPETIAALDDTLEYPAEGSASRKRA